MQDAFIQFDQGPGGGPERFAGPARLIVAWEPEEVGPALDALAAATRAGYWLAGYAAYELGYCLMPKLAERIPQERDTPLLAFGAFRSAPEGALGADPAGGLAPIAPRWDAARYGEAFDRVQAWISAGDIYQANLTFPIDTETRADPMALYQRLAARQPVRHGAYVDFGVGPKILSRSPELFFRTDAAGRIETRPMKGTIARGATAREDAANRAWLEGSEKNRAENLMIVDLLRNDISRIAEVGSVKVPDLFTIESYATVHQMISRVVAQLNPGIGLPDLLRALFPCGSITGAPKLRAMEIIRALEPDPRGVYCGAIGWWAPDGRSCFNVAIRTLSLFPDGRVRLNVGGGVVHDSEAASEYEEALWKARFADLPPTG
ncbi:Aminodeoxychorismate synthase component 1 [Pseudoruegeria aquimaris]|uniref:Aminodeoxychorismate synthase component 1 n=1 Tax=Pseudoruegeria aquimaris TaxID=393663 RepID=A0A1Y5SKU5_9RHOB|nr:aminodeoxychorismate synthase component I [Pseudoruegeria aquimaris]SLN43157.1 Aminodeoxychorismate synthase component 1 [Pseudoruegeria aquimaris]